ncbi:MAG TPA: hypothetical protein PKM25_06760 [Candidatus Ozemobacteraceae bacterium]|mgnify:CR=1 FL=1|nr:hypothetical protein [Candidatus Ozemobacteraceae bacterium]
MLVNNVVASITPDPVESKNTATASSSGDFTSVLKTAADQKTRASGEIVQSDATEQSDSVKTGTTSEASDSKSGVYAMTFSWYMRVADDVKKAEPPALKLFHDVAERISNVFLKNGGWSGNPIQSLLNGTESVLQSNVGSAVQSGSGQIGSWLGSLLQSANSGLQSLSSMLNAQTSWPGLDASSLSGTTASGITSGFGVSSMADLALVKLQYGNGLTGSLGTSLPSSGTSVSSSSSGLSSGTATARPLPRNRLGGQIVMISTGGVSSASTKADGSAATSSASSSGSEDAARRFLEAFMVFVESLKKDLDTETKSAANADATSAADSTQTASSEESTAADEASITA